MKIVSKNNKAFTLIELLVVVAIVSLLASVILASLNSSRSKGRDSARIQSFAQIRNALEIYRSSNGSYPVSSYSREYFWNNIPDNEYGGIGGQLIPGLTPTYIAQYPFSLNSNYHAYFYVSDGNDYAFMGGDILENPLSDTSPYNFSTIPNPITVYNSSISLVIYSSSAYFSSVSSNFNW